MLQDIREKAKCNIWITLLLIGLFCVSCYYSFTKTQATKLVLSSWISKTELKSTPDCTVIFRYRSGRLGNRLFMFASAFGLSRTYSCRLYIDGSILAELRQSFTLNLPKFVQILPPNMTTSVKKINNHCSFILRPIQSNVSNFTELIGFWQVQRYFINYTNEIRHQLQFKQTILQNVTGFLNKVVNASNMTSVGIHIRRGDYVRDRSVSSTGYIFAAMAYFTVKYRAVRFFIATDDKNFCQKMFNARQDVFFTPTSFGPAEDLAMLTLCNHVIITVGTFGWWGAFLNKRGGEVLTDSKPDYSPLDVNCRRDDYFPFWFSFLNSTKRFTSVQLSTVSLRQR